MSTGAADQVQLHKRRAGSGAGLAGRAGASLSKPCSTRPTVLPRVWSRCEAANKNAAAIPHHPTNPPHATLPLSPPTCAGSPPPGRR